MPLLVMPSSMPSSMAKSSVCFFSKQFHLVPRPTGDSIEEESQSKSRSQLQTYLKSQGIKAIGPTIALRQTYLEARGRECGLAVTASPARNAAASDAESSPKGEVASPSRKRAALAPPEKRLKRYRTCCSASVRQRIVQAQNERLYLGEAPHQPKDGDRRYEFVVMGSIGDHHTVTLANLVHCTCTDHRKGNVCKHILYVLLKVVGLDVASSLLYQTALLNSELDEIFGLLQARMAKVQGPGGVIMVNADVQKSCNKELASNKVIEQPEVEQQPIEGDCPICFDPLVYSEGLVYCKAVCGKNFHATCMAHWKRNHQLSGIGSVSCPGCHAAWQEEAASKSSGPPELCPDLGDLLGDNYSEWFTVELKGDEDFSDSFAEDVSDEYDTEEEETLAKTEMSMAT